MFIPGTRKKNEPTDWAAKFETLAAKSRQPLLRDYYARGAVAPATPLEQVPLMALDLETTGLDSRRHGIVSIGLVPFSLKRIHTSRSHYWVVRPRREVEERSITIHRITHEQIESAPDLESLAEALLDAIAGQVLVVHYQAIERPFLYRAFERRFGEGLLFPLIDTLQMEKRIRGRVSFNPLTWLVRRRHSWRLADCRRRYGLPEYAPHHALTDALATAELFQAQVAYHGSPDDRVEQWWQ